MKFRSIPFFTAILFFFCVLNASAESVTVPNTFTAGTKAVASQVNANFAAVKTAVDDNDSRISDLESRMDSSEIQYTVVSGDMFRPRTGSDGYSSNLGTGGTYITTENSMGALAAQAHIPDGATITQVNFYVYDNDPVNDLKIFAWFFFVTSSGYQAITPITDEEAARTSGASTGTQCLSATLSNSVTADNSNRAIQVLAIPFNGSTWSEDLKVMGVTFEYTLGGIP